MIVIRGNYIIISTIFDMNGPVCEIDLNKLVTARQLFLPRSLYHHSETQYYIRGAELPAINNKVSPASINRFCHVIDFDSGIIGALFNKPDQDTLYHPIGDLSSDIKYYSTMSSSDCKSQLLYLHKIATSDIDFLKRFRLYMGCSDYHRILKLDELRNINVIETPLNGDVSPLRFYKLEDIIGEIPIRKLTVPVPSCKSKKGKKNVKKEL